MKAILLQVYILLYLITDFFFSFLIFHLQVYNFTSSQDNF